MGKRLLPLCHSTEILHIYLYMPAQFWHQWHQWRSKSSWDFAVLLCGVTLGQKNSQYLSTCLMQTLCSQKTLSFFFEKWVFKIVSFAFVGTGDVSGLNGARSVGKWHFLDSPICLRPTAKDNFALHTFWGIQVQTGKIPEHPFLGMECGEKPGDCPEPWSRRIELQEHQILWSWTLWSGHWGICVARGIGGRVEKGEKAQGGGWTQTLPRVLQSLVLQLWHCCHLPGDIWQICLDLLYKNTAKSINSVTHKSISHDFKGADEETDVCTAAGNFNFGPLCFMKGGAVGKLHNLGTRMENEEDSQNQIILLREK